MQSGHFVNSPLMAETSSTHRPALSSIAQPAMQSGPHTPLASHNFNSPPKVKKMLVDGTNSGKENEPIDRNIPISAPIPVSHSALGKEAFKSILSAGEEEESNSEEEDQPHTPTLSTRSAVHVQVSATQITTNVTPVTSHAPLGPTESSNPPPDGNAGLTMQTIRAATPSTMMALTEPCLLAWCLDYTFDEENAPIPYVGNASLQQSEPMQLSMHSVGVSAASTGTYKTTKQPIPIVAAPDGDIEVTDPGYPRLQWNVNVVAGGRNMWGY